MKRLLMLTLLVSSLTVYGDDKHEECNADDTVTAQASALLKVAEKLEADGCATPNDYKLLCGEIATQSKVGQSESKYYEYAYEKRMWKMACANPTKDSEDEAKQKMTSLWNNNQKNFKCDSVGFNVPNGNILKFSITKNATDFIETLVLNYDLDINYVDAADNRNLLDYLRDEIQKLKTNGASQSSILVYEKYRESLIGLGAKYSKP